MTTVAMNNLWNYIQGLQLTSRNQKWLADRLLKSSNERKAPKDDALMTEEEFFAGIDEAREQIRRGEGVSFTDLDEMNAWLNKL